MSDGPLTRFYRNATAQDADAIAASFAENGRFEDRALSVVQIGREAVRAHFAESFGALPGITFDVHFEAADVRGAGARMTMHGPADDPFAVEVGTIAELDGDGRIVSLTEYWNRSEFPH